MSVLRPSPDEERWLAVGCRERGGGWHGASLLKRGALFALGGLAAVLTFIVLYEMHFPAVQYCTALCLLIAAESLIVGRRLFGGGFEEALEAAALVIVAFSLTEHARDPVPALGLAAALGAAGLRLLNPVLTTLAAVALTAGMRGVLPPGYTSFALAALALALSLRTYRRPSHDRMLDWLIVVMPLCAFGGFDPFGVRPESPWVAAALSAVYGGAALVVGVRRRLHAPLIAFLLCVADVAYELRRISGLQLETRLVLGGACLLGVAVALERWLRSGRGGITSQPPAQNAAFDLLQLAGSLNLARDDGAPADRYKGGGGSFGGGGADGGY